MRRIARTASLSAAAIAFVALAGCATAAEPDPLVSPSPSTSPAPSVEPTPSATSEPESIDTSDWLEYSTHDGDMTYRYPADWTLAQTSTFFSPDADRDDVVDPYERWMDESSLTAPNGQELLHSVDFVDIGGWCDAPSSGALLHTEPADVGPLTEDETPIIAVIAFDGAPMVFAMGITAAERIGDGEFGCPFYFVFGSSDGGISMGTHFQVSNDDPLWNIDSLDDAYAYMETEEYATLLEILRSARTA